MLWCSCEPPRRVRRRLQARWVQGSCRARERACQVASARFRRRAPVATPPSSLSPRKKHGASEDNDMTSSSIISALALALSISVIGCSGSDATTSLDTSQSKLTDAAGDALFTVKLDDAPDDGYVTDTLLVKVTFDKT